MKGMEKLLAKLQSTYRIKYFFKASDKLLKCFFFQVTRYIHHKINGKLHDAKVMLALGNTVWIDPMVSMHFS